jgi:UDP-glucose 4-epimerase
VRVVVTGASGNVGTSVLASLARDPAVTEIVALARRLPRAEFAKTSWRHADVTVTDLVPLFDGADVVIHLAWLIQPSRDERLTHGVNVEGSTRVFEATARAGVGSLVYASSVGAYGPGPTNRAVDERWPTTGISSSFYSRQKAEVERLLDAFEARHPEVRAQAAGKRKRPQPLASHQTIRQQRAHEQPPDLAGGVSLEDQPRSQPHRTQAVHSADVGEAYRLAATRPVTGAFNIAAEPVLDARTLGRALDARTVELPVKLVRAAALATWKLRLQPTSPGWLDMGMDSPIMDLERAHEELKWHASTSTDDAVIELLDGLRDGAGVQTPPLSPHTGGTLRRRELAVSHVGANDGVEHPEP